MDYSTLLAQEFHIKPFQVEAVIALLDEGNTIPFIARYRKEKTGSLDDQLLREISERLTYLRNLDKRREEIVRSLEEQEKCTDELREKVQNALTLAELEDIYRPFKQKRRTRATIAKEKGLENLATTLMLQFPLKKTLEEEASAYIDEEKGVLTAQEALDGARDIIAEIVSDDALLRKNLRALFMREGVIESKKAKEEDSVYSMYYDYKEPVNKILPHRVLAINRGEREEFLKISVLVNEESALRIIKDAYVKPYTQTSEEVALACEDAYSRLIYPSIEREVRAYLTDKANENAIRVFSKNLHQLLMQPPIKGKRTLGVDPGFRTGCKLAVVDENGNVLETGVGYFTLPNHQNNLEKEKLRIKNMIKKHKVTAVAIGNGTASRESETFVASILKEMDTEVAYIIVSEAGASVYSASKLAAEEFPEFDVSLRSAVSIARRMQDPLAELVKIDPKSIGVGQYQHDLKQNELTNALDGVVEQCVNLVGVDVETASKELLSHVAGIGKALAKNIVDYRTENGIISRAALKKVPKLGPRAFEQCAGFLRVMNSKNPLDKTSVHPESYDGAKKILSALEIDVKALKNGGIEGVQKKAEAYGIPKLVEETGIGVETLQDILKELEKPGRDIRDSLPKPLLRKDVLDFKDLKKGMELKGTVRNVIDFGAFVDIGVHQDGLVHISKMVNRYIKHPSEVVKVGDVVTVYVEDVDEKKKRISLSMLKKPD